MNCPEHYVLSTKYLKILHWQRADVRREYVTWREVLNPLRYEVSVGFGPGCHWTWNDGAWMRIKWSNFWFYLRKGCWLVGHDMQPNKYRKGHNCSRCMASLKEGE